jgi:cyclopropane-fatty-acyl-phospholipid synthase
MHARSKPVRHKFAYPVYFYRFDLDELEKLDESILFFGHNRIRPVALHDRDYLLPGTGPLKEKLEKILLRAGFKTTLERVDLVTSARVMHYVFNPVSFFFCRGPDAELEFVVVQVNNTFGEMHIYVLAEPQPSRRPGEKHFKAEKVFHVSPFFDRIGTYDFYFADPDGDNMDIIIQHSENDEVVFAARLTGKAKAIGRWTVATKLILHPLRASLTMPRIIWQAARLRFQKHLSVYRKPPPASPMTIRPAPPGLAGRLGRWVGLALFKRMDTGRLVLEYPEGQSEEFGSNNGLEARIKVVDHSFFRRTLFRGDIGFGEGYVAGEWTTDDLPGTLALLSENLEHLKERHHMLSSVGRALDYARHLVRSNTVTGSRRNISSHYDLSNDFFRLFLDDTLTYSCGVYACSGTSLEQAQRQKIRAIIEKADIRQDHHVLEIGCGWGSFAMEAAESTGCRVTGITISRKQLELARRRVKAAGLEERITLELLDYRHLEGKWDRIVSIEMLEAVGHANLGRWFEVCGRSLMPGGKAVVQVITIPHERYGYYRRSSDWIRKHIFPGGHLPSRETIEVAVRKHTDMLISDVQSIGSHYARTLRDWSMNLEKNSHRAISMGYDETFLRKWHYYFAYCQAGFKTGAIDNLQIVMDRPEGRTTE